MMTMMKASIRVRDEFRGSNRVVFVFDAADRDAEDLVAEMIATGEIEPDDRIVCLDQETTAPPRLLQ